MSHLSSRTLSKLREVQIRPFRVTQALCYLVSGLTWEYSPSNSEQEVCVEVWGSFKKKKKRGWEEGEHNTHIEQEPFSVSQARLMVWEPSTGTCSWGEHWRHPRQVLPQVHSELNHTSVWSGFSVLFLPKGTEVLCTTAAVGKQSQVIKSRGSASKLHYFSKFLI